MDVKQSAKQANVERFNTVASDWDSNPGRVLMAQAMWVTRYAYRA